MKKIIVFILLTIFLSGCDPRVLPIHQATTNTAKIELLITNREDVVLNEMTVMAELTGEEVDTFLERLQTVTCRKHLFSPPSYLGKLVVCIYYQDGSIDVLGTGYCEYYHNGKTYYENFYYLDFDEARLLFSRYIDPGLLPAN